MTKIKRLISFLVLLSVVHLASADELFAKHRFGKKSAVLVMSDAGETLYSWNEDKLLIPASTIKIATSIAAIEKFGLDYRFKTEFFVKEGVLWVKGYGDPFLTSEELDRLAGKLIPKIDQQLESIHTVIVDGTHFPLLRVPGRNASTQPYDAPLAAVSANFNTIKVKKSGATVVSAEPQTPITPLAKKLAKKLSNGIHRINLLKTENSEQYFAELLSAKLDEQGLQGISTMTTGFTPVDAKLVYRHVNSHTVEDSIRAVLFYSNNFIANQLFLQMREEDQKIGFESSSKYMQKIFHRELNIQSSGLSKANIIEGSGLSRGSSLTAQHLVAMLLRFKKHKHLMKSYLGGKAYAKTGTLNGVHNLVGYLTKNGKGYYFVFLFNETVPWRYRTTLLKELYATL